jgi:hypothetical protein
LVRQMMVSGLLGFYKKLCRADVRRSAMQRSAGGGVIACFAFAVNSVGYAEYSTTNYVRDVDGYVTSIEDDGSVTLTRGGADPLRMTLWGLTVTDIQGLRDFMMNRNLECKIIHELGPIPEADCLMYPQKDGETIYSPALMRGPISVFDWVPDLGFAVQQCPQYYGPFSVSDGSKRFWHCSKSGKPSYNTGFTDEVTR